MVGDKLIPIAEPDLSGKEAGYVLDAIKNEQRISSTGKYLDKFESDFAFYCQRRYGLACSNGTAALHLAIMALGIGPGDEVIVPVLTFAASAAAVVHAGATPVFIDVKAEDWLLDETKLNSKLSDKTKAIIAVDLYGLPCNYAYLSQWCQDNNIFLIEDAAEAHGATYQDKKVGSFGDVSCFSFYGNKVITTGEGGICLTDNEELFQKMKVLKNHGMKEAGNYRHEIVGYNYRLTNVQAAIGCAQLERIEKFLDKRRNNYELYLKLLEQVPGITFQKYDISKVVPTWWLVSILIDKDVSLVRSKLKEKNIDSRIIFPPLSSQKPYQAFSADEVSPISEQIARRGLSLPSSPLLSSEEIIYICDNLKNILRTI